MFLNSQEAAEVTEERVDAMLALRRAEERRLAGSEVCARDWTPTKKGRGREGRHQKKHLTINSALYIMVTII